MKCALYPCFDITCGRIGRGKNGKEMKWVCGNREGCKMQKTETNGTASIIEKFSEKAKIENMKFKEPDMEGAREAVRVLKSLGGLGNGFLILSALDKKTALEIERKSSLSNIGVLSCLARDIVIAFSHNSGFRPPPFPEVLAAHEGMITGEQTNSGITYYSISRSSELVLPPMPFPEIKGKNVCSSSPSPGLDKWLRQKMNVKEGDATLLLGFDNE